MTPILARVFRNNRLESLHRGHIAVTAPDGQLLAFLGNPDHRTYMRSAAKPLQILPMLQAGADEHFGFTDKETAVIMASHNGEPMHIEAVQGLLSKIRLTADALKCGFHLPMHEGSAAKHIRDRAKLSPVYNNCSGKHAGMLAMACFHEWPLDSYLEPEHRVQQRIKRMVAQYAGVEEQAVEIGMDGCSAPVFYLALRKMALMFAKLSEGDSPEAGKAFGLMWRNPEMIAGTGRFDTKVMQVMKGKVVSKVGAEGVRCLGVAGERPFGIALKIEDGNKRASQGVALEILRQMGVLTEEDRKALFNYDNSTLHNHAGFEVGSISVDFELKYPSA